MSTLVFLVGLTEAPQLEDSYVVIDLSKCLPTAVATGAKSDEVAMTINSAIVTDHFKRMIRSSSPNKNIVVTSFPQTEDEAKFVLGYLKEGYRTRMIVSGHVEKRFKQFLRRHLSKHVAFLPKKSRRSYDLKKVIGRLAS